MEKLGMKESTKQERRIKRELLVYDPYFKTWKPPYIAFEGSPKFQRASREELIKLGYYTRLLPFVRLKLCNCFLCDIRTEGAWKFDLDYLGNPCTKIFAINRQLAWPIQIGVRY